MPWTELTALLLFATAMSFTPGPNTTLAAALAAHGGLPRAMPFVLGVPVGWGLLLLACALGLGGVLQAAPVLRGAIKWLGLATMLWLAWKLAHADRLANGELLARADPARFEVGFFKGVMLQFVNIKAWMNALLISAGWVHVADPMGPRLALVLPLMMAYGLASNFTYALVGSALRGWLQQGARLRAFNRMLAGVLVATALWMSQL